MAARVADRQKDRLIVASSGFECFIAPAPPIDRIFGVFPQVKAFGLGKSIRHEKAIHLEAQLLFSVLLLVKKQQLLLN
jgi:hypothetical protein